MLLLCPKPNERCQNDSFSTQIGGELLQALQRVRFVCAKSALRTESTLGHFCSRTAFAQSQVGLVVLNT
jgi:hypothetical protein